MVHVEGDDGVRGQGSPLQKQQVSGQLIGQVGLARAAGARQDDAAVLPQQRHVALQHGLGDESVEDQRVHALVAHAWTCKEQVSTKTFQACLLGRKMQKKVVFKQSK